mmetsp:Transcript_57432/g.117566  ORF Transcript_57432/g.117566 Transcript_57432/m.117566 type:complete len:746 (+) Transcript_57432:56-2293(+)
MGGSESVAKFAREPTKEELLKYEGSGPWWTSKPDGEQTVQYADKGRASKDGCPTLTFPEVFKMAAEKKGKKPLIAIEDGLAPWKKGDKIPDALAREAWKTWTVAEFYEESRKTAKAMMAVGLAAHDSANAYGFNSPEWFLTQLGVQLAGGKIAGIYPSDNRETIQFKSRHSNAAVATVESKKNLETFVGLVDELPYLKAIVAWGCPVDQSEVTRSDGSVVKIYTWADFLAMGEKETSDADLDARVAAVKPGHACALIYTSGTTGNPKAVMVSHDSLIYEALVVLKDGIPHVASVASAWERIISYLPLSHVAGMMVDIACPIVMGALRPGYCTVYFARPYDLKAGSIGARLNSVNPTLFLGVPRVWEKIMEKLKSVGAQTTGVKKKIATWAKGKGLAQAREGNLGRTGRRPSFSGLADKLVLSKVRDKLGLGECKFAFTGAAPIAVDTLEYFGSFNIQINEVYGMSECTGATTWSTNQCHLWGSVGFAASGMEVKVFKVDPDTGAKTEVPRAKNLNLLTEEEQGEICFRGRHIMMGYMANPDLGPEHVAEIEKKNADAIDSEGWLHSGDKGAMSDKGMVKITGRYKEIIVTAGGENVAQVPIEDNLKQLMPAVSNVVVIGDKKKFLTALVTLKAVGATGEFAGGDELDGPALEVAPGVTTVSGAMKDETWANYLKDSLQMNNDNGKVTVSNAYKVQKVVILPRDLSVETGDLTATLKLKRGVVVKKYEAAIDAMYASSDTVVDYVA